VAVDDDDEFNAYATGSNEIVMFKGIAERSRYDEEVAYILAHELSHHMLNHIRETGTNQLIGNVLGTLVGLAAAAWVYEGVDCNPRSQDCDYVADGIQGMVDIGSNAGTFIANRKYSVAQESEADWLTAYILSHADFSLIRAREAVVHMAVINDSTSTRSSFFDSHPVGPERLSQFDTAIQEVLSNVSGNPRAP
jgi:Zn-dependent protease with chaperone function